MIYLNRLICCLAIVGNGIVTANQNETKCDQIVHLEGELTDQQLKKALEKIHQNKDIKELHVTAGSLTQSQLDALQLCAAECKGLRIVSSDGQRVGNLFTNWAPYLESKKNAHETEGMYESTKKALELFQNEYHRLPKLIVDFGCATGQDTIPLAKLGCAQILAVDADQQALGILKSNLPKNVCDHVQCINDSFQNMAMNGKVEFFIAAFTFPYRTPKDFDPCWKKAVDSIVSGGYIAGQLFGNKTTKKPEIGMTYHTEDEVRKLLEKDFEILWFKKEAESAEFVVHGGSDPAWGDLYHFVARKR